jgi:deferrochelatase/peroxidase EfeB
VANSAAALYNSHQASIAAALTAPAQAAVADADAKATAVRDGLADVKRAFGRLAQAAG